MALWTYKDFILRTLETFLHFYENLLIIYLHLNMFMPKNSGMLLLELEYFGFSLL